MKKHLSFLAVLMMSAFSLSAQWGQLGSDLIGEADDDAFGRSSSINAAGNVVITGAWRNDENGDYAGHARVFEWDGTDWIQVGADIDGDTADVWSGWEVEIDASGNTIAVTSLIDYNSSGFRSGLVKVFDRVGSNWIQRGNDIEGEGIPGGWLEWFGNSLSLSADGNTIAIGGPLNKELAHNAGFARVYNWDGSDWVQLGDDIDAEGSHDEFGFDVSLNSSGTFLAVGGPGNDGWGNNQAGYVKTYAWSGTNWDQIGNKLTGEFDGDEFGRCVSLNDAGNVLAVGAYGSDILIGNMDKTAYVYEWDGSDWVQRGSTFTPDSTIGGEFGEDVDLDSTGNILAISAPAYWGVSVIQFFEWDGNSWMHLADIVDGTLPEIFGTKISLNSAGNRVSVGAYNAQDNGVLRVFENQSTVGIEEDGSQADKVRIYPNPASDLLTIELPYDQTGLTELEVFDLMGRSVLRSEIQSSIRSELDVSALSPGQYLLRISNDVNTYSKRFFVTGQ